MPGLRTAGRYCTEAGVGVPAVTAAEMRELDRIATEETGPNLFQMMENAGRSLASLGVEVLGRGWEKAGVVVLAGGGGQRRRRDLRRPTSRQPRRTVVS